ncbi:facilitated trehalose transporter Tret1-2 homolog [Diachasma alloeum]|uniref:facilitated trehalose transporter Tret1-2 homolog n=1 Tax=Diachasma alloeum TaxID=454923 RepID=UPI0007381CF2|nr:facilitated trehalose transporter Tret1-2 homolog [Diachasma alloeum]
MRNKLVRCGSWPQWIAAVEIFLMAFLCGVETGWTSPSLAILLDPLKSPIPMTKSEGSWIASLLNIGRAAGSLIGAIDVELVGSKTSALHIGVVQLVSLVCLAEADTVIWLYASRFIGGVATGMFFISFPLYIGEISNPKIRGALVGTIANGMSIGYVVGNVTGAYMSIPAFAISMLAVTVLFLISFYWLPKSSHHLVLKDQMEEAAAAIKWYQRDANVPNELASLQKFIKDKQSMTFKNLLKEFMLPHNRIALFKVIMVYVFMQLSGLYTVGFYMEIILKKGGVTVIEPVMAVIVISAIGLVGGCVAMFAIDKFGRKLVLATSAIGLAVSLVGIAIHYQFLKWGCNPLYLQWLIIFSVIILECFINLGIVPIPSTILSEIFAPNIKSYSSCIANIISGLIAFMTTQTYQLFIDSIDYYVYYIYALMMILLAIFTMTQLPETKGKTLQEIQNMLMKK